MKPINLTEDDKIKLFEQFIEKFKQELDNFGYNGGSSTISIKTDFNTVAKDKVLIIYTQAAYLRMKALVEHFSTEVAWYGLVNKIDDITYQIYDVKVCKQYVNGAKVDTEDEDVLAFYDSLTDDEAEHMHFQAHSHVNMATGASGVDLQNQADIMKSMGKSGFFIFQIWNKKGDINTYIYDLDNNTYYDRKDVELAIEDSLGTLDDFIDSVTELVTDKKAYVYDKKEIRDEKEHTYLQNYWDGTHYYNAYGDW